MRKIIINLENSDIWKIQLTIDINSISSNLYTSYNDANEAVNELFEPLRSKYRDKLETSMKGRDFIYDSVQLMYCKVKCSKVNFKRGGSYVDSPNWIKNKKATLKPKN